MVDIGLGKVVVGAVVDVDRKRMGRDLCVVGDIEDGRKLAEVDNKNLKRDLGHRKFGKRKDLVTAVHRNLQNRPSRRINKASSNDLMLGWSRIINITHGRRDDLSQKQSIRPKWV